MQRWPSRVSVVSGNTKNSPPNCGERRESVAHRLALPLTAASYSGIYSTRVLGRLRHAERPTEGGARQTPAGPPRPPPGATRRAGANPAAARLGAVHAAGPAGGLIVGSATRCARGCAAAHRLHPDAAAGLRGGL